MVVHLTSLRFPRTLNLRLYVLHHYQSHHNFIHRETIWSKEKIEGRRTHHGNWFNWNQKHVWNAEKDCRAIETVFQELS